MRLRSRRLRTGIAAVVLTGIGAAVYFKRQTDLLKRDIWVANERLALSSTELSEARVAMERSLAQLEDRLLSSQREAAAESLCEMGKHSVHIDQRIQALRDELDSSAAAQLCRQRAQIQPLERTIESLAAIVEQRVASCNDEILKFGAPSGHNVKKYRGFVVGYDRERKQARWSCEKVTLESLRRISGATQRVNRKNSEFKPDPSVPEKYSASLEDYRGSGYDRGHLTPAGNMKTSQEAMNETFFLSNISPQVGNGFNRHYWARLEQFVRDLAYKDGNRTVYCCTGPLYLPKKSEKDGRWYVHHEVIADENDVPHVAVPTHFFKVIVVEDAGPEIPSSSPRRYVTSFVLPNEPISPETLLRKFEVSVEDLESMSGLDFQVAGDHRQQYESGMDGSGHVFPLCQHIECALPSPNWWKDRRSNPEDLQKVPAEETLLTSIREFVSDQTREKHEFSPQLPSSARRFIHQEAEKLGLAHRSFGEGEERRVIISRKDASPADGSANPREEPMFRVPVLHE